ncbi:uncharacterized protein LOC103313673 [Tribolium castaneum]|uniref:Uncharacterized protein n=1 Tax=Tribolium castaneum TaxID=7070 RepID=D6WQ84_TRICA|nr:PREDICTED: uncharacterized protein LOC103313673 [Tribolium castaneum]EFA06938.1 hypothetical protein TcasGA2_TC009889 [Tribolium castaneum]|eukprot:XP_008195762.1 PREDICTED: uncharacterized protein LOC103313673 [Tribolium castaneum]
MDYALIFWLLFAVFSTGFCASIEKNNSEPETVTVRKNSSRKISLGDLMTCGLTRDISCFLDAGDAFVEEKKNEILAQADMARATGRANDENSPSHLSKAISRIVSELTDIFKDSIFSFFKSAREGEEDDEIEDTSGEKEESSAKPSGRKVGESRKKKKKEKLIGLIKLIIIGIVLKAKITLLLKALSAALQVKFFLVALAGLILNAARFYLDLKKGHQPQKVIYYEHAQHQHHYEGDDDWGSSGPGGGYWGRSYDEEETSPHSLAYAKQRPYKRVEKDEPGFSWFG